MRKGASAHLEDHMSPLTKIALLTPVCTCLALLATWALPKEAKACGGTFCDAGPQPMPVDQTGENILFVMEGGYTEAHIQIQYDPDTDADSFAWLVPVTVVPTFSVGSEALFQSILANTVPSYGIQRTFDDCGASAPGMGADDGGGEVRFDAAGGETGGPEIVHRETVGAFEIAVLSGGTAAEVMNWLGDNGYQQDPAALPLLEQYLGEGLLFAAFKLKVGAETSEIHPIVLRFDNDDACIPIRLTRIAATEDMDVRAFFLAESRVVPANYRHVLINSLKIDWPNSGANYKEVITLAVDAEGANGHAFVTEYAGASTVVGLGSVYDPAWDPTAFAGLTPIEVIDELRNQRLLDCAGAQCFFGHLLLEGILADFLPAPDGVENEEYWECPACFAELVDPSLFDAVAFAAAIDERIVAPALHAVSVIDTSPYLTRMYTTISPGEMTVDPLFHQNAALPEVAALRVANQRTFCNGDALWTLPDGREVYLPAGQPWPEFTEEMPWEEDVEEVAPVGAPMALIDRTDEINALLAAYNAAHGWADSGGSGGSGGGDSSGASEQGGVDAVPREGSNGCGCRGGGNGSPLAALVGLCIACVGRRRAQSRAQFGPHSKVGRNRSRGREPFPRACAVSRAEALRGWLGALGLGGALGCGPSVDDDSLASGSSTASGDGSSSGGPATLTLGTRTGTAGADTSTGSAAGTTDPECSPDETEEPRKFDVGTLPPCDIWAQDCEAGSKCIPFDHAWLACVTQDPAPLADGDVCEPAAESDPCGPTSWCALDPGGATASCTPMCTGSPSDPVCPPDRVCIIDDERIVAECQIPCDPFDPNACGEGTCQRTDRGFGCQESGGASEGERCDQDDSCGRGLRCAAADEVGGCCESSCCAAYCSPAHPCAAGTCTPLARPIPGAPDVGSCVTG